jgi:hypothetical protein
MATEFDVRVSVPRLPSGLLVQETLFRGLQRWLKGLEAQARMLAPARTGALRGQIQGRMTNVFFSQGAAIQARLTRGKAFYGHILEHGVDFPYQITPKRQRRQRRWEKQAGIVPAARKKALRFVIGGQEVFATSVWHPGFRARPHFRPAFATKAPELVPQLSRDLEQAFQENRDGRTA